MQETWQATVQGVAESDLTEWLSLHFMYKIGSQRNGMPWFPLWLKIVKNPPANSGRQFNPWCRKIPHATEQLSLCATILSLCSRAQEPQLLKPAHPRACNLKQEQKLQWEARTPQLESNPHSPQLEENQRAVKTQHSQKFFKTEKKWYAKK